MLKKIAALLLSAALAASLAGCAGSGAASGTASADGNSGGSAAGQVTLNVWHQWTNEADAMRIATDEVIAAYMAEHPDVKIEAHMLENEAYKTKISTEFAGSAKGVDLFFYWGGGRGGKLAEAGKLLAIDDYLSEELTSLIKPGATAQFVYGDQLYGLPIYSWIMILYCNQDLFDAAGAKVPETYDELLDACKKLRENNVEIPIAQGIKEGWQAAFVYEALAMREVGVDNLLKMFAGETGMDDPGYLAAAEKTKALYEAGAFGDNPLELANGDADTLFLTGKSAMRLQGNWFSEMIYVDKNSTVQDANIIPVNIPMTGGGKPTDYCGGYIDTFFINKNTAQPEVAVDFYMYLCQELARVRQESGQGFSGYTTEVDESQLPAVSKMVSDIAKGTVDGAVAWDTALDEAKAAVHLDAVQSLFTAGGDPAAVIEEHKTVIN